MREEIRKKIESQINQNKILIYMKGTKEMPQCGFSARVVEIFKSYGVPFETVNVLADPELRQALKEFSNWPTFPQVYINGKFIGGCDICVEMDERGELEPLAREAVKG
ncbi:MAG: glutaredoxin [Deltaproteobacteria bacterium]|jgi:monothiol glutaredoxin|nr:Glutaredoxin 4 [bacterium HR37]GIW47584.1 MAG: glutaredoxin [Deltaproteobacteria bacterium]